MAVVYHPSETVIIDGLLTLAGKEQLPHVHRLSVLPCSKLLENIEHEVTPIISGHCVTLTRDLFTEADDSGALPVPARY